ncbi:MAG: heavy-metal-associated domain-containing protein [Bacteroidales bacterium]|nr:heavy-metal-associated domain-containing protein [Bacteroidales bacterium]
MKKYILIVILVLIGASVAFAAKPKVKPKTVIFEVSIHCQNCVNKITDKVSFLDGVDDLKVSLKNKTVIIKYNPDKVKETELAEAIQKLGYTVKKKEPKMKALAKESSLEPAVQK